MKKLLILLSIMISFTANTLFAQDTNQKSFLQKITVGFILDPQVNVALDKTTPIDFTSMKVNVALFNNINFITKHTYHNICYVWGGNALVMVNGWFYMDKHNKENHNQDIYLVLSKNFSKPGGNILIAWEHELPVPISAYGAIEVGTSWDKRNNLLMNLCLTIPFNIKIWERK